MIYGERLIHRTSDLTDKIGIRTLVLSQMWQPSNSYLTQDQIDDEEPNAPGVSWGMLLVGTQTRPAGGVYRTSWTYEGIRRDGKGVTFKDRSNTLDYQFVPGLSQVSIKQWKSPGGTDFKNFPQLLAGYEGVPSEEGGEIIWPLTLSKTATARGLSSSNHAGAGEPNPMFGIQEYFRMEGSYTCRYASIGVPAGLNTGIGRATSSLPGKPPSVPGDRNWLKLPPTWRQRGYITEILETYWLSGVGGWPVPVYGGG